MHLLRDNGPTVAAFLVFIFLFAAFAGTFSESEGPPRQQLSGPAVALGLPAPHEDADVDTYADVVDVWDGDLVVVLEVTRLRLPDAEGGRPYLLVGTQDDHWRTGAGAELEWSRVYDHDPFGHPAGSPAWIASALRTGSWWRSLPGDGHSRAIASGGVLEGNMSAAVWPQTFHVNVRDDRARVTLDVELWDDAARPARLQGFWRLEVDTVAASWREEGADRWLDAGSPAVLGSLSEGGSGVEVLLRLGSDLAAEEKRAIAARWAPDLHFAQGEAFFPARADALERFHGFWQREGDHRTWSREFNNGRDAYRLLVGDFNGDGMVDHRDAVVMTDVLRVGGVAPDTVYANVVRTTGDQVVVQYWFIYLYNFVPDETGRDVASLAHPGDREFIQLVFADEDAAANGRPLSVAYSQHYDGVSVPYAEGAPPFHRNATRPAVFVALGSHASYPVAGTDAALRSALTGYGDVFRGDGDTWTPDDYALEVLGPQVWHGGYLWGPYTRHARDLGTPLRPLLQHGFTYPFMDPLQWGLSVRAVEADRLSDIYGTEGEG